MKLCGNVPLGERIISTKFEQISCNLRGVLHAPKKGQFQKVVALFIAPPPVYDTYMGYCCTLVMPPAQCFYCNFHTVWASVCDKSVVYFFFQAAATVKISTNLEHFENFNRYASVTTFIETCRAQSMHFFWPSKYFGSHFWTLQPRSSVESSLKPLFPSASNGRYTYVLSATVFERQSDYWSF